MTDGRGRADADRLGQLAGNWSPIEGRIKLVQVGTIAGKSLEAQVFDDTGGVRLLFFGRTRIAGIEPGTLVRATGRIGEYKGHLALANPRYELVAEDARSLAAATR